MAAVRLVARGIKHLEDIQLLVFGASGHFPLNLTAAILDAWPLLVRDGTVSILGDPSVFSSSLGWLSLSFHRRRLLSSSMGRAEADRRGDSIPGLFCRGRQRVNARRGPA